MTMSTTPAALAGDRRRARGRWRDAPVSLRVMAGLMLPLAAVTSGGGTAFALLDGVSLRTVASVLLFITIGAVYIVGALRLLGGDMRWRPVIVAMVTAHLIFSVYNIGWANEAVSGGVFAAVQLTILALALLPLTSRREAG